MLMIKRGLVSPSSSLFPASFGSSCSSYSSSRKLRNECAGDTTDIRDTEEEEDTSEGVPGGGEQRGEARGRSGVKSCVRMLNGIGVGIEDGDREARVDGDVDARVDGDVEVLWGFLKKGMFFRFSVFSLGLLVGWVVGWFVG